MTPLRTKCGRSDMEPWKLAYGAWPEDRRIRICLWRNELAVTSDPGREGYRELKG